MIVLLMSIFVPPFTLNLQQKYLPMSLLHQSRTQYRLFLLVAWRLVTAIPVAFLLPLPFSSLALVLGRSMASSEPMCPGVRSYDFITFLDAGSCPGFQEGTLVEEVDLCDYRLIICGGVSDISCCSMIAYLIDACCSSCLSLDSTWEHYAA
ncbi:hypothetical protein B0H16DRAFT_1596613, partial [Mycena metata]